eukprot:366260-Chlamydomonas_euryale.AAC.39
MRAIAAAKHRCECADRVSSITATSAVERRNSPEGFVYGHVTPMPGPDIPAVSLIDFTASRLIAADGSLACCDLGQDPEIFEGPEGDIQVWDAVSHARARPTVVGL